MIKTIKRLAAGLAASIALPILAFVPVANAANQTVVVTGNTVNESMGENGSEGWWFNRDATTMTPYEFNDDAASIGRGSLYVKPISANPSDKFIAELFVFDQMSTVNSFSYDFKIGSGGVATEEEQFYLNVYANFNVSGPTKFYDCRYNVIPTAGSTTGFTTVTFDPTQSYSVTQRNTSPAACPASPAAMGPTAYIRAFAISLGDTSNSDQGLDGYFDKVVYSASGNTTTYDFEPKLTPSSKDDCKNGGWANYNTPKTFKNQGQCISYMSNTKTTNYTLSSSNINGINIPTMKNNWYEITVSGTFTNSGRGNELVDAECTSWQGGPWMNAVFGGYSSNLLDTQVNQSFVEWGPCDAATHSYTTWVESDGTPINVRVFDGDVSTNTQNAGWAADNVGNLNVSVTAH